MGLKQVVIGFLVLFVCITPAALGGCKKMDAKKTIAANEDVVKASPGAMFSVEIDSNATTGYQWKIVSGLDEKVLTLEGSDYVVPESAKGMVGVPGKQVFTFKATGKGKAVLTFTYQRPWEKDQPPAKTKKMEIEIGE